MGSKHIICSNFCKELFLEDIAKATSVIARSYFYSKDKKIILQNKKITKSKTYLSQSIFVFQCHHGIRANVSSKTRKIFGELQKSASVISNCFFLDYQSHTPICNFLWFNDLNSFSG